MRYFKHERCFSNDEQTFNKRVISTSNEHASRHMVHRRRYHGGQSQQDLLLGKSLPLCEDESGTDCGQSTLGHR